ncbi:ATP-binding protein [Natronomonas sp. LN261]|uniref:ATP-binding protein n=1 Tax=Natronomonas sp. LN261 TaxID=2750669 RepID=UPI0015EFABCD|nr:ATP-binding protein [Natronomonas sp. LN261]
MSSEQEYYDLSPDKRTLRSIRSDVTPITAVEELVDNVLDNWRRVDSSQSDITIDIDFDFEKEVFRIEDDSGGLNEEDVKKIFALGGSTKEEIPNSIGSYGMGAKKAILRLGNRAVIKSRVSDADTAYGFVIDEEWLYSDNWQVTKQQFDDVDPGSTVIRIEGLDIELQEETDLEEDMDDEEASNFDTPEEYLESLRTDLSETYDEFLKGRAGPEDSTVSITVNAVRVQEQPEIDWAYTPFDGYHPRFYQQYEIDPEEIPGRDEPITVDIKAGLMRTGKSENAGTDVIIQNRRVLTSDKTEMGGWGTHLPSFRPNLRRTRFIVKITAESHPETLPWDTQKDKIEPNSVITDRVFNVLRRAASDYTKVTYDNFTTAYTAPYDFQEGIKDEDREPWQKVQPLNYNDRHQFIADHKPDSQLPETEQIEALVDYHQTELEIFAPHIIADEYANGYRAAFDPDNDSNGIYTPDEDSFWILPDEAKRFPEQELHMIIEAVKDTAERHARAGITFDFEEDDLWWRDYYERVLSNNDSSVNTLDVTEDLDGLHRRIKAKGEEQDLVDPILTSHHLRAPDLSRAFSDDDMTEGAEETQSELPEHTDENSDEETTDESADDSSEDDSAEDETETTTTTRTVDDPLGTESDGEDSEDDGNSVDEEDIDFGTTTGRQIVQERITDMRSVILRIRESAYQSVCEDVGLDPEEAQPRDVGQAIVNKNLDIYEYIESGDNGD